MRSPLLSARRPRPRVPDWYHTAVRNQGPGEGQLQFDVTLHRLELEYGVRARLEKISARYPRWVTGPEALIEKFGNERGRMLLYDAKGQPLILFEDAWGLRWALERETGLTFHEVAP